MMFNIIFTRMKKSKKDLILEKGLELMHLFGYNGVGIKDIVDSAGAPKGSFYSYFSSKEQFGIDALECYAQNNYEKTQRILTDTALSPVQRLIKLYEGRIDTHVNVYDKKRGCFICNLSLEMSGVSGRFQQTTNAIFTKLEEFVENCLQEAQAKKEISSQANPKTLANIIEYSWRGAVMRVKTSKDTEAFKTFMIMLKHLLANA